MDVKLQLQTTSNKDVLYVCIYVHFHHWLVVVYLLYIYLFIY